MNNKRGISLIVLIITIVVVIILAAAVILSLSGNNPINNARIANLDQTKDGIESSILAYTGKAQSKTLGYYTVAELLTGNRSETESYGIIGNEKTKNKKRGEIYNIDKIKFEEKIDTLPSAPTSNGAWYVDGEGNVYLVYDKKDDLPNWAKNKDGEIDDSYLNQFVVIKEEVSKVSAKEVAENAPDYYGKTVTNYTANGVSDWKIFHSDGTNIYLISSEYIPLAKVPATKIGRVIVNTNSKYPKAAPLTPAVNDPNYDSGSASISNDNPARKWLKSYLDSYSSSKDNMKVVAYMLDTYVWNVYKNDKADYAIGGPTIEMLFESYNKKNNTNYQAKATDVYGYQISKDGGANWSIGYGRMLSTSETLYVINSSSEADSMWLASTYGGHAGLFQVDSNGTVYAYSYASTATGFRPVVCLNSEVSITDNGDGSVTLKSGSSSDDSNRDDNTSKGSAKEVAYNASEYYGKTVTNYSANGVSDWKIFHSDGTNIYLISNGYLSIDKIPATKGGSAIVNKNSSFPKGASLFPAVNDSNYSRGSESISSSNPARKWLKSYLDSYKSSNDNMKAVAYMFDTDIWTVYKTDKAEYAIGGPTVEMLMESYSKKMGVDYQAKATSAIGYQVSKDGGANLANYYNGMLSTSETLYVLPSYSTSGAQAMWLASPSANASYYVMFVFYDGSVAYNACNDTSIGFRPVVCLNSGVSITDNGNGSVTLN